MNNEDYWFDENENREWFFNTSDFYECCFINLTDLYELSDREVIENGEVYQLKEWLHFRR